MKDSHKLTLPCLAGKAPGQSCTHACADARLRCKPKELATSNRSVKKESWHGSENSARSSPSCKLLSINLGVKKF